MDDGWMMNEDGWMDGQMKEYGWMDENGRTDGCMYGWMDG